ncbi:MAG: acyl carrier protein [Clostridiales bacterium]|nr:acyl carrier protein [Clostridiales bacterium]
MDNLKELIIKNANPSFVESTNIDDTEFRDLMGNLGYDSISIISLVVDIESRYGIEIDDEYLLIEHLNNIDNLVEIISNKGKYNHELD